VYQSIDLDEPDDVQFFLETTMRYIKEFLLLPRPDAALEVFRFLDDP